MVKVLCYYQEIPALPLLWLILSNLNYKDLS